MENTSKFLGIIGLIALRKTELYSKILNELSKQNKKITENKQNKIKKYIALMPNELFISKREKDGKRIYSELTLKNFDIGIGKLIHKLEV